MAEFEDKLNEILSSPETMGQIMALANSIAGTPGPEAADSQAQAASPPPAPPGGGGLGDLLAGLDPTMLTKVMSLFSEYQRQDDEKAQLLAALKPFLRQERQVKVEQALRITRLSRVIRSALSMFKGGEDV